MKEGISMVCPKCGNEYDGNNCNCGFSSSVFVPKKKPIYKKWWFWVLIVVVVSVIGGINGTNNDKKEPRSAVGTTESSVTEKLSKEKLTEAPTESPAKIEADYKKSCKTIDFKTLSRNPDKNKGNYKLIGQVIQVQESSFSDEVELRINITKNTYEYIDDVMWTDTIYATVNIPDGKDKLLKDDVITFWGYCEGEHTYTTVLGNDVTLPIISIKYYELAN